MSSVRHLAQIALGVPFAILGGQSAADPGPRVAAAEKLGLPEPELMVRFNGAAMVAGGVALSLNILPRAAAGGLAAALVPTTLAGHAFWEYEDETQRRMQRLHFLKNTALIGGLLAFAVSRK